MHTYSYKECQYNIINNKYSMLYLWYAINAPYGYGIVITLYLYTTTNQHHLTPNSIFPILPFPILPCHVPTYPRSHLPIPYTTILTYIYYFKPIPITHYIVFIISPSLTYSPQLPILQLISISVYEPIIMLHNI